MDTKKALITEVRMVRINIINPKFLTDQHLIAEYNEMLMLVGYVKKYPCIKDIPERYVLGKGHMKFFKNKLLYIKKRHENIKKEMRKRNFKAEKTIYIEKFPKKLKNDFKPSEKDKKITNKRLMEKIESKLDDIGIMAEKEQKNLL